MGAVEAGEDEMPLQEISALVQIGANPAVLASVLFLAVQARLFRAHESGCSSYSPVKGPNAQKFFSSRGLRNRAFPP